MGNYIFTKGKVYLLGSIHVAKKEIYPLNSTIEECFNQSNCLVVEVNVSGQNVMKAQTQVLEQARYAPGNTLKGDIPSDLYDSIGGELEKNGLDINLFNNYKPWMLYFALEALLINKSDYNSNIGVDMHFLEQAGNQKKEVRELESAKKQIELFANFSKNLQIKLLKQQVGRESKYLEQIDKLVFAWKNGDAKEFEKITFGDENDSLTQEYNEKIIIKRNQEMKNKIENYLKDEKKYFIVVGAAHLVGEKGILKMFEKSGYEVRQKN